MKCFECGAQIREEARFCPYCGKDQSERPVEELCVHCGQPLMPNAKFCGFCGGDQSKQPEAAPVEVPVVEEPVLAQEPGITEEPVVEENAPAEPEADPVAEEVAPVVEETAEEVSEEEPPVEEVPAEDPVVEEVPAETAQQSDPEPVVAQPKPEPVVVPPVAQPTPEPVVMPPVAQPAYVPVQEPRYNPAPVYQPQPVINPVAPPVVQPMYQVPVMRPAFQLPNKRAMWKMILLSLLTLGIYPLVIWCKISMEINVVASRHDGKWTMHFMCMTLLAPLTLMIYPLVWLHGLCNRIGDELIRRKVNYKFSAATFWLWNLLYPVLGAVVTALLFFLLPKLELAVVVVYAASAATAVISMVGPFVYLHKHMKAMNLLNTDYNERG